MEKTRVVSLRGKSIELIWQMSLARILRKWSDKKQVNCWSQSVCVFQFCVVYDGKFCIYYWHSYKWCFFFCKAALDRERCILSDKMCVMVTVLTVNYTHLTSLGGGEAGDRSLFFGFNINFTNTLWVELLHLMIIQVGYQHILDKTLLHDFWY